MLRYNLTANDSLHAEQVRQAPCVYLDHWALRLFSTTPELGARLRSAINLHGGTLAMSVLSWAEFTGLTDASQVAAAAEFVESLLPRLFFLRFTPFEVLEREKDFEAGRTRQTPEGDEDVLRLVTSFRAGLSGWTVKSLFTEPSERRDEVRPVIHEMVTAGIERVRNLRTSVDTIKEVQHAKRHRLDGMWEVRRATQPLLLEMVTELEANRSGDPKRSDIVDLFHVVVPCSYCDFVLIDTRWRLAVERAKRRMLEARIPARVASVFSKPNGGVEQFLLALEGFSRA